MSATTIEKLTAPEVLSGVDHVTYRMLNRWCGEGLFGPANVMPGSGARRTFTDEDRQVLAVLGAASALVRALTHDVAGLPTRLLRDVASVVRIHGLNGFLLIEPTYVTHWPHRPLTSGGLVIDLSSVLPVPEAPSTPPPGNTQHVAPLRGDGQDTSS